MDNNKLKILKLLSPKTTVHTDAPCIYKAMLWSLILQGQPIESLILRGCACGVFIFILVLLIEL